MAALRSRQRRIDVVLVAHGAHVEKLDEVLALSNELGVPVKTVDAKELTSLAHGASHGGILAVCSPKPRLSGTQIVRLVDDLKEPPFLLLLEGVDDARNLGFTLRTAEACGAHAVMIKKHLWDFDPVEVARPSSGAYERLPLAQVEDVDALRELQKRGVRIYGCIAGAKRAIYDVDLTRPMVIAIGGEKRGLSGAVRSICDRFVTIPTVGGASSLSLSHAGAIVMAEVLRQRRAAHAMPRTPGAPPDEGETHPPPSALQS